MYNNYYNDKPEGRIMSSLKLSITHVVNEYEFYHTVIYKFNRVMKICL